MLDWTASKGVGSILMRGCRGESRNFFFILINIGRRVVGSIYRLAVHVHGSSAKREKKEKVRWELIIATLM